MKPEQQRLLSKFEVQARYSSSCLKAFEFSPQEVANVIAKHCLDFEQAADELGFFRAWLTRRKLRKLRDRLIAQIPVMATQRLPKISKASDGKITVTRD